MKMDVKRESHSEAYFSGAQRACVRLLSGRSAETGAQCQRVGLIAEKMGRLYGLTTLELGDLYRGAVLHDVGKVMIPKSILGKPGPLSLEERSVIEEHPRLGFEILSDIGFPEAVALMAAQHHERFDGTGYPAKLLGPSISLYARIFSVVDTYDAIVSNRCYRAARSHQEAVLEICAHSGTQFDPDVVGMFLSINPEELDLCLL